METDSKVEVVVMLSKVTASYPSEALQITSSRNSSSTMTSTRIKKRKVKLRKKNLRLPTIPTAIQQLLTNNHNLIIITINNKLPIQIFYITIQATSVAVVQVLQIPNTLKALAIKRSKVFRNLLRKVFLQIEEAHQTLFH